MEGTPTPPPTGPEGPRGPQGPGTPKPEGFGEKPTTDANTLGQPREGFGEKPTMDAGGVQNFREVAGAMQPQPGPDNWDQQAFADRARAAEAARAEVFGEPRPISPMEPTNDAEAFARMYQDLFGDFKPSPEYVEALRAAASAFTEKLTGKAPSSEDIQRVTEAVKAREGEDRVREEGERRGLVEGSVAATLHILQKPEFAHLFPADTGERKPPPIDKEKWEWLLSKLKASESGGEDPPSSSGSNPPSAPGK